MASKLTGKIVEAAIECFSLSGFHGCTTKGIADRADCTEGSLFRLYGSKEKLFEAALHKAFENGRMSNEDLARVLENDQNFERGLRRAMLEFFDQLKDRYVRIAMFAGLERPEMVREFYRAEANGLSHTLAHTIEREIYRGNLRDDIEPVTAAMQLVLALWYLCFVSPTLKLSKEARRAAVKNFVEIWVHGMQKSRSKPTRKSA